MKIIAYYLPQFHQIPENDVWWGEGFTEWVNVKKAKPLFDIHEQPRVPINEEYYNLLNVNTIRKQVELAKKNNIWGFCFYHYWFGKKHLLEKPMELFLENTDIDLPFCISWANENWTNQWVSNSPKILVQQEYGEEEEWKRHFEYLLPFFKDSRYIKENNKPVVVIYKPTNFDKINDMIHYWNALACAEGFSGVCFMSQISYEASSKPDYFENIDYYLDYQPTDTFIELTRTRNPLVKTIKEKIKKAARVVGVDLEGKKIAGLTKYSYTDIWTQVINKECKSSKSVPGCFVDWDNTPRKGEKGTVLIGANPTSFKEFFKLQVQNCRNEYKKSFMFIFAWNEWAEGGYLEPDQRHKDGYLKAIKSVLEELGEIPTYDSAELNENT